MLGPLGGVHLAMIMQPGFRDHDNKPQPSSQATILIKPTTSTHGKAKDQIDGQQTEARKDGSGNNPLLDLFHKVDVLEQEVIQEPQNTHGQEEW